MLDSFLHLQLLLALQSEKMFSHLLHRGGGQSPAVVSLAFCAGRANRLAAGQRGVEGSPFLRVLASTARGLTRVDLGSMQTQVLVPQIRPLLRGVFVHPFVFGHTTETLEVLVVEGEVAVRVGSAS